MATLKSEFNEPSPSEEKTLPEYFLAKAAEHEKNGKDYWLIDSVTEEKRTFKNFEPETRKIASAFYKLGLRKGDIVIYMIRDLAKAHILIVGVWRANGVMRALYPDDDEETVEKTVREARSAVIVCEEENIKLCLNVAKRAEWKVNVITVKRSELTPLSLSQFLEEDIGNDCPSLDISEEDPAIIFCTSGTTGPPKGAVHTHKGFLYNLRSLERMPWVKNKGNLLTGKATHIGGVANPLIILSSGKSCVVVSDPTKANFFKAADKYKAGLAFSFPTLLMAMAGPEGEGYDFSNLEVIYTGGTPITPTIKKTLFQLPNLKSVVTIFGLTEMMLCATDVVLDKVENGNSENLVIENLPDFSVGKPYAGTEVQVRDPDSLAILGPNCRGEIWAKSPGRILCYWKNPEASENAFVDDFLRTGDIGYYDKNGFIYVVDRLKEIFKYNHNHISPTEIENVIGKHTSVSQVCVVGVDDIEGGGHVPRAFVVVHPEFRKMSGLPQEITKFANEKLASYKQLRGGLHIVDDLPRGKSGKVTRHLVAKLII